VSDQTHWSQQKFARTTLITFEQCYNKWWLTNIWLLNWLNVWSFRFTEISLDNPFLYLLWTLFWDKSVLKVVFWYMAWKHFTPIAWSLPIGIYISTVKIIDPKMIDCKTETLAPVALEPAGVWGENKNLASLPSLPCRFYTRSRLFVRNIAREPAASLAFAKKYDCFAVYENEAKG